MKESLSERVLARISPPTSMATFEEVEGLVGNPGCITLCLRSTYEFVRDSLIRLFDERIDGDVFVVGVWKGGMALFVQSLLVEHQQAGRRLFLADTFSGFPPVSENHSRDRRMREYFSTLGASAGSVEEVRSLMDEFGLYRDNVEFVVGDIRETAMRFSGNLAMLFIDVDFYEPTRASLDGLYSRVNQGGLVYVDDYGVVEYECRQAVDDFRQARGVGVPIMPVNEYGVAWRKE